MTPEPTDRDRTIDETPDRPRGYRPAPHWVAVLAAVFTWPLLFVGGLVTTYRVGMAVPDWPTTFGINMFLYDMSEAAWGVLIEHGHRLYGAAVGVCAIVLMLDFLAFDRRKSVKALGVLALLAVIGQGVLGGLRVNNNSTLLAMVHGCTGQAYFAFVVVLATITGRSWFIERIDPAADFAFRFLRLWTLLVLTLAALAVVVGAFLRHFGGSGALIGHLALAGQVVLGVPVASWLVRRRKAELPGLMGPVRAMELTVAIQAILGIAATVMLWPFDGTPHDVTTPQALVRTGHQANAALLLSATVVLALRLFGGAAGAPIVAARPLERATARPVREALA